MSKSKRTADADPLKAQIQALVAETKLPRARASESPSEENSKKPARGSVALELDRVTRELKSTTSQLRLADEEVERVWFDKTNTEKELRGQLEGKDQAVGEIQRERNDLAVLLRTKDDWISELELKLKTLQAQPDDAVLERELKLLRSEHAELTNAMNYEIAEKLKLSDRVALLTKQLDSQKLQNDNIASELHQAQSRLLGYAQLKRDFDEAQIARAQTAAKLETVSKDKDEQAKQIASLNEQLSQNILRLRSHFQEHKIPDFESERKSREFAALLDAQRLETAKYSAEATRLSEELREIKCSTVEWLTGENERLRRKAVEAAKLLAEEQDSCSEFKEHAVQFKILQAETEKSKEELERERVAWAQREAEMKSKLADVIREKDEQKVKLDKLLEFKNILSDPAVLSGLHALQSLTDTVEGKKK